MQKIGDVRLLWYVSMTVLWAMVLALVFLQILLFPLLLDGMLLIR